MILIVGLALVLVGGMEENEKWLKTIINLFGQKCNNRKNNTRVMNIVLLYYITIFKTLTLTGCKLNK